MDSFYSNTDLDLVAEVDISELVEVFRAKCLVLSYDRAGDGKWYATVEASLDAAKIQDPCRSIDSHMMSLLSVAEHLESIPRMQWNSCVKRDFNIGFECGDTWAFSQTISQDVVGRAAAIGCTVTITLYPIDRQDDDG